MSASAQFAAYGCHRSKRNVTQVFESFHAEMIGEGVYSSLLSAPSPHPLGCHRSRIPNRAGWVGCNGCKHSSRSSDEYLRQTRLTAGWRFGLPFSFPSCRRQVIYS